MPDSRRGDKPPESTANSLAVSFVGLGRSIPVLPIAVGLHGNLKSNHFQIFGGYTMPGHIAYINFLPQNFLLGKGLAELPSMIGSKERRKGVNA